MTFDPKAESKITSQNNTSNVNIQDGGPASKTSQNFRLWSGNDEGSLISTVVLLTQFQFQ